MVGEPNYEQVVEMARELKILLENHLLENPEEAAPFIDRACQIKNNIESFGLLVKYEASLNTQTLQLSVEIDILKPKENMTPDEQKPYDEWLLKKAGIDSNIKN